MEGDRYLVPKELWTVWTSHIYQSIPPYCFIPFVGWPCLCPGYEFAWRNPSCYPLRKLSSDISSVGSNASPEGKSHQSNKCYISLALWSMEMVSAGKFQRKCWNAVILRPILWSKLHNHKIEWLWMCQIKILFLKTTG